jgi:hypothetical protein
MAEEVLRAQTLIISTGPIIKEVVPAGVDQCQYYIEPATSPSLDRPRDPKPSLQIEDIRVILKNLINSGDIDLDVIPFGNWSSFGCDFRSFALIGDVSFL